MFRHTFDVNNGFLPSADPLNALPEYSKDHKELLFNKKLNSIIKKLPFLLKEKKLGEVIDSLEVEFKNQPIILEPHQNDQQQVALLFLSFIAQAYVFEHSDAKRRIIPSVIAKNLYHLSYLQQRRPMLTYNEFVLHNWQRIDVAKSMTLDNIEPIVTFTGTKDEAWFIKIHVAIEAAAARAIRHAKLIASIDTADLDMKKVKKAKDICMQHDLSEIADSMKEATHLLRKMQDNCNPQVFWNQLRQYFNGWNTIEADQQGRKGVTFLGINELDSHGYQYFGPSGAQSSIVPALDAMLNIKHEINSMFEHLSHFKDYMPKEHRIFIDLLSLSKTRQYIKESNNVALQEKYDEAVDSLWKFRGAHMSLLHAYIYKPAAKEGMNQKEMMGTGGSPLQYYLSERFKSTKEQKLAHKMN